MNVKKLAALGLAMLMVLMLAACGAKQAEKGEKTDKEPQTAEEAAANMLPASIWA